MYTPSIGRHVDKEARHARREKLLAKQRSIYGKATIRPTEEERFWALVDKQEGCWGWKGYVDKRGRSRFSLSVTGLAIHAARWVWAKFHGPIPEGKYVCHKCDNPVCVNVEHLFLGSPTDNVRDMIAKGRATWQKKNQKDVAILKQMG